MKDGYLNDCLKGKKIDEIVKISDGYKIKINGNIELFIIGSNIDIGFKYKK